MMMMMMIMMMMMMNMMMISKEFAFCWSELQVTTFTSLAISFHSNYIVAHNL